MLSRALRLATVTLLIGCLTAVAVHAVENLEAGKSPAQIFAGTCNACHKSPRGLLKSVPASSLPGFLRQHYTTSSDMASVLSSYLVSNGAADTRYQGKDGKEAKEAKQKDSAKEGAKEGAKEARAPAEQGAKSQPRLPRAGETPDLMRPDLPAQAAIDKNRKDKDKGKKGRTEEQARTEPTAAPKDTAARTEESAKPAAEPRGTESKGAEPKTETARSEPDKDAIGPGGAMRPDPVPAVTPAPATATAAAPATSMPSATPGASSSASPPPVQPLDTPSAPAGEQPKVELPKPAVAAAPALPPVPPAGPPMVPISQ